LMETASNNPKRRSGRSYGSPPNKRIFETLLSIQPFTGIFRTIRIRFQALQERSANDRSLRGALQELWYKDSVKPHWGLLPFRLTLGPSFYTAIYQFVDSHLAQSLSSAVCQQFLRHTTQDAADFKRTKKAFEEGNIASRPGLYAGYLMVKSLVFGTLCLASHPFSVLHTEANTWGDVPLPEAGFWKNVQYAGPWNPAGTYWSSLGAHVVSCVAEVSLKDLALRTVHYAHTDFFKQQKRLMATRSAPQTAPSYRQEDEDSEQQQAVSASNDNSQRLRAKLNYTTAMAMLRLSVSFLVETLLYPILTVRARLEANASLELAHVSILGCARSILEQEGHAGLYRGFRAHVLGFLGHVLWIGMIYGLTEVYIRAGIDEEEEDEES